jgi:hypothetical protein
MSFADEIPELYPAGTAQDRRSEITKALDAIDKVIREHPNATVDEQHSLIQKWCKSAGYSVSWAKPDAPMQVFIASSVAPELDCWIDVSWPLPRTLDSEWQS